MFRFTIRDLLWLMVVVGLMCGWWLEHRRSPTRQLEFRAAALEQAIHGHGFKVQHLSPFRARVESPCAIVEINHEKSSHIADPFGPAKSPATGDPFTPK
jgi:hypothetical protein